jgi:hypothetical protein
VPGFRHLFKPLEKCGKYLNYFRKTLQNFENYLNMKNNISPKYQMALIKQISDAIWNEYKSYKEVKFYIEKWHHEEYNGYGNFEWANFQIKTGTSGEIDLPSTLNNIDGDTLLKIAIDLGVDTPDFIPSIPTFRNEIKADYPAASATFEKAFREIESHPDFAVGLVNSALESIIKEILKDSRIETKSIDGKTLYDLTKEILKEFKLAFSDDMPSEIRTIGKSMLAINQSIESLRSTKTGFHGKTDDDYVIDDPTYTYFIVNSVTTVGLFLKSFYLKKYPKVEAQNFHNPSPESADDLPF